MSLIVDEAYEETSRRMWLGVCLVVIGVLAVAAFLVGRAQAQEAKSEPTPARASTAIDQSEDVHHATQ